MAEVSLRKRVRESHSEVQLLLLGKYLNDDDAERNQSSNHRMPRRSNDSILPPKPAHAEVFPQRPVPLMIAIIVSF